MPVKIIQSNHWQIVGKGTVLLACPPANDQTGDLYTGRIVEEAALLSKGHALIEKEQGNTDSPDPVSAHEDFQDSLSTLLEEFEIRCVLEVLGQQEPGIDIRAVQQASEHVDFATLIRGRFDDDFVVRVEFGEPSELSETTVKVQTTRLLLGPEERGLRKDLVISKIADLVGLMNAKLGHLETNERVGSALD